MEVDDLIAMMAATIYAQRTDANMPNSALDWHRKAAIAEAYALCDALAQPIRAR